MINEAAWKGMKVADPIGMELQMSTWGKMHIVGVVKDFNFQSLREKIKPAILYYSPEAGSYTHPFIRPVSTTVINIIMIRRRMREQRQV